MTYHFAQIDLKYKNCGIVNHKFWFVWTFNKIEELFGLEYTIWLLINYYQCYINKYIVIVDNDYWNFYDVLRKFSKLLQAW